MHNTSNANMFTPPNRHTHSYRGNTHVESTLVFKTILQGKGHTVYRTDNQTMNQRINNHSSINKSIKQKKNKHTNER